MEKSVRKIGIVILGMLCMTAILLGVFAVLVQKLELESSGITVGVCVIYILSCAIGGFLCGKVQKKKKFLWGAFMGICYGIIVMGLTVLTKGALDGKIGGVLLNFFLCIFSGMLGGMVS